MSKFKTGKVADSQIDCFGASHKAVRQWAVSDSVIVAGASKVSRKLTKKIKLLSKKLSAHAKTKREETPKNAQIMGQNTPNAQAKKWERIAF